MSKTGPMPTTPQERSRRVLFLPDNPHDGETAGAVLREQDVQVVAVASLAELVEEADLGAGALLIVEEGLQDPDFERLSAFLEGQAKWSDLPVIITTRKDSAGGRAWGLTKIANVTLIERPLRIKTLVTIVQAALRDRRRQYELRQSIANRDNFLAMLGHELRNPLMAISLASQMLSSDDNPACGIIDRQTRNLVRIVDDLREVSRISQGQLSFDKAHHDLVELLGETVDAFIPIAGEKGLELEAMLPAEPLWVEADAGRLGQVLGNLVSNAIRYTPSGGRIDVMAKGRGASAVVTVSDTGIGIPPEKLTDIFELFTRVHNGSGGSDQGMGLGLNLAYNIVQAHQGQLVAESAGEGKGATFLVTLPTVAPPVER